MKLGFFINAYRNFSIEYALESIAEQGYQGIELWAKGDHITPYGPEKQWREIERLTRKLGLEIYGISAHLDFVSPEEKVRKENIEKFLGCIKMANFFGVNAVHTASGGLYPECENTFKKQEDHFYHAMEIIGEEARKRKVIVALEPEPEKWLSTPEQVIHAINLLGKDVFRVLVDTGHCFGIGEELLTYLKKTNDSMHLLHVDDVFRKDFPHRHLIPGEGDIDFVEFHDYLRKIRYDGWLSVELNKHNDEPAKASRQAKKFMDDLLNRKMEEKQTCIAEQLSV